MPTFTAIALDRLIEPGAAKSVQLVRDPPDSKLERRHNTSNSIEDRRMAPTFKLERGVSIPPNVKLEREVIIPPNTKLERGVSVPPSAKLERGVSVPPTTKMERGVSVPPNGNLERGATVPPNGKLERGASVPPNGKLERGASVPPNGKLEKGVVIPSHSTLDRRNGASTTTTTVVDEKHHWTQISPALYATPESTPLPDSPSSFPPSPYIINHKRRGPRLMKSFSEDDVATWKKETNEIKVDENGHTAEKEGPSVDDNICVHMKVLDSTIDDNIKSSGSGDAEEKLVIGACSDEHGNSDMENGPAGQNGVTKSVDFSLQQDNEVDDFVDPQDSMSVKSIGENEGNGGAEQSFNLTTPMAEFYDAWEELSSESGPQLPLPDIESELREIRLSLLMEIEKRKQAEETLNNLQSQWQRICEQLSLVGLNLPADPTTLGEGEQPADPAAELCQQVYLARFVSNAIGRGAAKAEVEMEMEAQIKQKNFEIARLWDRLRYFEAVNQEMSQRNQEAVETARRLRQRRSRRQKWFWGSVAAAVTLGSAVLICSYFQSGKGSSYQSPLHAPEVDHDPK